MLVTFSRQQLQLMLRKQEMSRINFELVSLKLQRVLSLICPQCAFLIHYDPVSNARGHAKSRDGAERSTYNVGSLPTVRAEDVLCNLLQDHLEWYQQRLVLRAVRECWDHTLYEVVVQSVGHTRSSAQSQCALAPPFEESERCALAGCSHGTMLRL